MVRCVRPLIPCIHTGLSLKPVWLRWVETMLRELWLNWNNGAASSTTCKLRSALENTDLDLQCEGRITFNRLVQENCVCSGAAEEPVHTGKYWSDDEIHLVSRWRSLQLHSSMRRFRFHQNPSEPSWCLSLLSGIHLRAKHSHTHRQLNSWETILRLMPMKRSNTVSFSISFMSGSIRSCRSSRTCSQTSENQRHPDPDTIISLFCLCSSAFFFHLFALNWFSSLSLGWFPRTSGLVLYFLVLIHRRLLFSSRGCGGRSSPTFYWLMYLFGGSQQHFDVLAAHGRPAEPQLSSTHFCTFRECVPK